MVAYGSCDPMLQQQLLQKMNMTKLAVPFLLPPLHNENLKLISWAIKSTSIEWTNHDENAAKIVAKTVSFIRIGRPHQSKSMFINDLMGGNKHTFFNRN